MIDKKLLALLGKKKTYISKTVLWMIAGLLGNLAITAAICYTLSIIVANSSGPWPVGVLLAQLFIAVIGIMVRFVSSYHVGLLKDCLGRTVKKDLRAQVYEKLVRLGVKSCDEMSMAGLTQVAVEGIEQLDLYYSSYIPQLYYAMIAPVILFGITVWLEWHVALVLLLCVPLIPLSIIAISKYAKRIFNKYWG